MPVVAPGAGAAEAEYFFLVIKNLKTALSHIIAVKSEISGEAFSIQEGGNPQLVILPHLVVRHFINRAPEGISLVAGFKRAEEFICIEHITFQIKAVGEREVQNSLQHRIYRNNSCLLHALPHCSLHRGLPRFNMSARSIHLPGPVSGLLVYQQDIIPRSYICNDSSFFHMDIITSFQ